MYLINWIAVTFYWTELKQSDKIETSNWTELKWFELNLIALISTKLNLTELKRTEISKEN